MTYPALKQLLQGYLNLDWPDDYADAWAAIDDFAAYEPIAGRLADEVTMLLDSAPTEEGLREFVVDELGSGYLPEADGFRMRDWLMAVRQRVQGALGG
jgi:hypothetical protein